MKNIITKFNKIGNSFGFFGPHAIRWVLGIFLFYKGVHFMQHTDLLVQFLHPIDAGLTEMIVFHYVCLAHIMGGIMLFFGLLSRMAAISQIPILLAAIIANISFGDSTQIIISTGVLILLVLTAIFGSGKFSVDYSLKMYM
ncbi:MAG: putative oxidoreductase [Saprospiraceae bacterium]|jgi:putative oxidoreductase